MPPGKGYKKVRFGLSKALKVCARGLIQGPREKEADMRVAVVGMGSFGLALALASLRAGSRPIVWGRNGDMVAHVKPHRRHPWRLPGIVLPEALEVTDQLPEAFLGAELVIYALPSAALRGFFQAYGGLVPACPVVIAAKGMEAETGALLSEVLPEIGLSLPCMFLGGPHLAAEVAQGLPTAGVLGASVEAMEATLPVVRALESPSFTLSTVLDPIAVQVAGALKNAIALSAAFFQGMGQGENQRALHVAQGFQEAQRVCQALGGSPSVLMHPALLGDLLVTAFSERSRNTAEGLRLGRAWAETGKIPGPLPSLASGADLGAIRGEVVEGIPALKALIKRATCLGLELPFLAQACQMIHGSAVR